MIRMTRISAVSWKSLLIIVFVAKKGFCCDVFITPAVRKQLLCFLVGSSKRDDVTDSLAAESSWREIGASRWQIRSGRRYAGTAKTSKKIFALKFMIFIFLHILSRCVSATKVGFCFYLLLSN